MNDGNTLNTTLIMLITFNYCCHNIDFLTKREGKEAKVKKT